MGQKQTVEGQYRLYFNQEEVKILGNILHARKPAGHVFTTNKKQKSLYRYIIWYLNWFYDGVYSYNLFCFNIARESYTHNKNYIESYNNTYNNIFDQLPYKSNSTSSETGTL